MDKDLDLKAYDYELPKELIAQDPLADRGASRLLMLDKNTGNITHKTFRDIKAYLKKGDCLVLNETKVIPARLYGKRKDTGGHVEILLLKRLPDRKDEWEALAGPGKKARIGDIICFGNDEAIMECEIKDITPDGNRIIKFYYEGVFEALLDRLGNMPLPPYISHELKDKGRYQTVYAKNDGSAAAPTAGLHFTEEFLSELEEKGIKIAKITLHVGLGTFRPVKTDDITKHQMHTEHFIIPDEAAELINETKKQGLRVIAVGTTSVRTLESASDEKGLVRAGSGDTSIFIYPGYSFKVIDALITNFHLPESTLIMLVSALAGRENVLKAYKEAVENKYRFFSFGDAMLII